MADIFISFIHEEEDYAQAVQKFITRILGTDAKPFLSSDKLQIYAGEKWIDRIMDELKDAKVVLLILSGQSVKRPWVNFEAGAAWTRDIAIIPICVARFKKDDLPKPYSSLQAVELEIVGDDEYLARSVAHYLGISEPYGRKYMGLWVLAGEEGKRKGDLQRMAYDELVKDLEGIEKLRDVKAALGGNKVDP